MLLLCNTRSVDCLKFEFSLTVSFPKFGLPFYCWFHSFPPFKTCQCTFPPSFGQLQWGYSFKLQREKLIYESGLNKNGLVLNELL